MNTEQLSLFEQYTFGDPSLTDEQVVGRICRQILADAEASPPVDVDVLASVCGIAEVRHQVQIPAGMLFEQDGRLIASVRVGDGLERGRFTVLHEGGHTFQRGFRRTTQYRCLGQKNREEHLCDVAAAELLLPRPYFLADLAVAGAHLEGVGHLSDTYVASIQATALRLVTLSSSPLALLVFRYARKPTERGHEATCPPKLRLQWSATNGPWPYILKDKSVSSNSPIGRAWEGEVVTERGELDELFGSSPGALVVDAQRYGDSVLALIRRNQTARN